MQSFGFWCTHRVQYVTGFLMNSDNTITVQLFTESINSVNIVLCQGIVTAQKKHSIAMWSKIHCSMYNCFHSVFSLRLIYLASSWTQGEIFGLIFVRTCLNVMLCYLMSGVAGRPGTLISNALYLCYYLLDQIDQQASWQPCMTAGILQNNMHCISGYSLFFPIVFHIYTKTESMSFFIKKYFALAYNNRHFSVTLNTGC